jgi:hypothetical protein
MTPVPASILLSNPVSAPQASSAGPVVGAAVGVIALLGLAWFRVQKKRREPKRVRVYSAPAPVDDAGQAPADMPADAPGPQNPTQSPVQPVSPPVFIAGPIAVDPVTQGTFSVRPSVDVDVAGAAGALVGGSKAVHPAPQPATCAPSSPISHSQAYDEAPLVKVFISYARGEVSTPFARWVKVQLTAAGYVKASPSCSV